MAVFTRFPSRHEAVAFDRGGNRAPIRVEHRFNKLASSIYLAAHPAGRAWRDVTLYALDSGMRRILIGGKFRSHRVARRTAELRRFHMLNSPVRELSSYQHIKQSGYGQEPR